MLIADAPAVGNGAGSVVPEEVTVTVTVVVTVVVMIAGVTIDVVVFWSEAPKLALTVRL